MAAAGTLALACGCGSGAGSSPIGHSAGPTAVKEAGLPASGPLVLAARGTTLDADRATGAYRSETAWRTPPGTASPQTSGGGFSHLFARPAYQDGVAGIAATRGMPTWQPTPRAALA